MSTEKRNATTAIVLTVAGLALAWVGYELGVTDLQKWLLAIVVFADFAAAGWASWMSSGYSDKRMTVNMSVLTTTLLIIGCVMNFVFSFFEFPAVAIVVPNVLLILILVLWVLRLKD